MKKVFALLFVASVFAFASCGEKKAEGSADSAAATVDSTATAPAATDSSATDSSAAKKDSAATTTPAAH